MVSSAKILLKIGVPSAGQPDAVRGLQFGEEYGNPATEQMAIAVLATLPVFLLFLILQRSINRGFGLSGLK